MIDEEGIVPLQRGKCMENDFTACGAVFGQLALLLKG